MAIRWWIRYGKLQSADPEFLSARRIPIYAAAGALIAIAAVILATRIL
jgi:hypothetical protein